MPTIKAKKGKPIIIKSGEDFAKVLKESGAKVKLPFKATNWKSTKMPLNPEQLEGIELAGYENVKSHKRNGKKVKKYKRKPIKKNKKRKVKK